MISLTSPQLKYNARMTFLIHYFGHVCFCMLLDKLHKGTYGTEVAVVCYIVGTTELI